LVNTCRNFANKLDASIDGIDKEERILFFKLYSNFVFALKEHLREGVIMEEMEAIDEAFQKGLLSHDHKPNYIANQIFHHLNRLYRKKKITGDQLIIMDQEVRELLDIIGACERIKNTPIPYSYNLFLKKFIFIYITTLPLAIVDFYGYWSTLVTSIMFYILASTEFIAEEIEDPFRRDDNDLPTDDLSVKIKANIKEILIK
jgi:putative membrane protein